MTDPQRSIANAVSHLDWFKIPHTLEQVIGIYAEATREATRSFRHGLSNDEILATMTSGGGRGSKGSHSDPTPRAALWGEPDAVDDTDETLGRMDGALASLEQLTHELTVAMLQQHPTVSTNRTMPRQYRMNIVVTRLHKVQGLYVQLDPQTADQVEWVARQIEECAEFLQRKAEAVWLASRGQYRPVAVQKQIRECSNCASFGITGTIALPTSDLGDRCHSFRAAYKVMPTEAICRAWDRGTTRLPSGALAEALASKRKRRPA